MSREEELVVEASLADNGNGVEDVEDVENALREGDALPLLFDGTVEDEPVNMTRSQAYNLYTSHFLSTWNVRTYEFAAIIFTAAAYPETLTAAAVRGIVRTLASICFSSSVGRWVDHSPDRLKTLMSSISLNRFTVIFCSILWFFIVSPEAGAANAPSFAMPHSISPVFLKHGIFILILALGIGENLSASGNMMSMERDWVVVASSRAGEPYDLTHMNAVMRRIDLICKLIAPILISIIISATNTRIGVIVVGGMSASSWAVEMLSARHVWKKNPRLQELKILPGAERPASRASNLSMRSNSIWYTVKQGLSRYIQDFRNYFCSSVWIPSLSLSLLHLSALSYGATFITFLLSAGFSLDLITIARAVGSLVEISSTVVTPFGVNVLGRAKNHGRLGGLVIQRDEDRDALLDEAGQRPREEEGRTITGLERLGLWGLCWQLLNLVPVLLSLWALSPNTDIDPSSILTRIIPSVSIGDNEIPQPLIAAILFTFLSSSRLGLWIYDLTTQQLTQTMVLPSQRSSFAGVEYSFNAFFELTQHITVLVLSRPEDFYVIASMGVCAVLVSTVSYAAWVRSVRGHLVHWERFGGKCGKGRH